MRAVLTNKLFKYEEGTLGHEDVLDMFQELVSTGHIKKCPQTYQKTAQDLLDFNIILPPVSKGKAA